MTMRIAFLFIASVYCTISCYSQKPAIDSSVYSKWPTVNDVTISNDGAYCQYIVKPRPIDARALMGTLIVKGTTTSWKVEIQGAFPDQPKFTSDSKLLMFLNSNDSLGLIHLNGGSIEYIPHVQSYNLQKGESAEWMSYKPDYSEKQMILRNLHNEKTIIFDSVIDYSYSSEGSGLFLQTEANCNERIIQSVLWFNFPDNRLDTIWQGINAGNFVFDLNGPRLAFKCAETVDGRTVNSIWYYENGKGKAIKLADDRSTGIDAPLHINSIREFSKDGTLLYFNLAGDANPTPDPAAVKVDVWSYRDSKLQSQQLLEKDNVASYLALIHLEDQRIVRLEYEHEHADLSSGDFALIDHYGENEVANNGEANWNAATNHSIFLESVKDGKRRLVKENVNRFLFFTLSPGGKYVIYYNYNDRNFFCYTVSTGITRNITQSIVTDWTIFGNDNPDARYACDAVAGWLKDDSGLLMQDQNDIWQVDPTGSTPPFCLTNGYGRAHHIVFRFVIDGSDKNVDPFGTIILSAFNRHTKENGFYSKMVGKKGDPELLTMGPFIYDIPSDGGIPDGVNFIPIKALDAKAYIVWRMNAYQSPNYFYTSDFRNYTALSDVYPEKDWNWYKTELHTWKTPDDRETQGILYKPENFDAKKKYPLIFYYYEMKSDGLNGYLLPEPSSGSLNITWYVSNGYLVFTPDIHYTIGETGKSALDALTSATNYLSRFPWIDLKKLGIQGHSFGGYETNYLVTHSHLFAAACSASGIFDLISDYGGLYGGGTGGASLEDFYEMGQLRIGHSLWERPDLFIRNSPIFSVNHVTTPILMMHTKNDGICPFPNAVEFFTALRRLGKKAWMLQYDEGDHSVGGKSGADFDVRMQQFFNHYLKGVPAPRWMIEGIPASKRGIDDGLALEPRGVEAGANLLFPEEQKKVDTMIYRKPINVALP